MKTKVAQFGAGGFASQHARIYSEFDDAELSAICDLDPSKKKIADRYGCNFYTHENRGQLLKRTDIEYAAIVVNTAQHHVVANECLENFPRLKCLFIEKPMTETLEQARSLLEKAEKRDVLVFVGHQERYNPPYEELFEMFWGGSLGEISVMSSIRANPTPVGVERRSGVMKDLAIHDADLQCFLLRKMPVRIYAEKSFKIVRKPQEEDVAHIMMYFYDESEKTAGVSSSIYANWVMEKSKDGKSNRARSLNVVAQNMTCLLDFSRQRIEYQEPTEQPSHWGDYGEYKLKTTPIIRISEFPMIESLEKELRAVIDITNDRSVYYDMKNHHKVTPATGWEAMMALETILTAEKSSESKQPIQLTSPYISGGVSIT
jgi:UDP-N-acetylglucosamine 3-dehydrogenase